MLSLPPDIPLPALDIVEGDHDLPDAEEGEDLPTLRPEQEYRELVKEERNETEVTEMDDDEAINNDEAPNAPD